MKNIFQKYVEIWPIKVEYEVESDRAVVLTYRPTSYLFNVEKSYCPLEMLNEILDSVIPDELNGEDINLLMSRNLYALIQDEISKNGYIVDEIFEVYIGAFVMAFASLTLCLNEVQLTNQEVGKLYCDMFNKHRNAIPSQAFMRRKY
jgi:hypothetical protein